jgi:hypothetical protein
MFYSCIVIVWHKEDWYIYKAALIGGQRCRTAENRDLTILGRQRDGDGQNKLLQINDSKDIVRRILSIV